MFEFMILISILSISIILIFSLLFNNISKNTIRILFILLTIVLIYFIYTLIMI